MDSRGQSNAVERFEVEQIRVDKIKAPMLVIGLGGSGVDGLLRIKHQFAQRFVLEESADGSSDSKPPRTAYLAIDSSRVEMEQKSHYGTTLSAEERFSIDVPVNTLLSPGNPDLKHYETQWLDSRLAPTDITHGAGTIRQIGRLKLFRSVHELIPKFTGLFQQLFKQGQSATPGDNRLTVVVIAGLSGGTGSGTFLDIPYLLRHALESVPSLGMFSLDISLYAVSPDVTMQKSGATPAQVQIFSANSFAALKELDYWMAMEENGASHTQQYNDTVKQEWNVPPYKDVTLLCANRADGTLIDDAYNVVMDVLAESQMFIMAGETSRGSFVSPNSGDAAHSNDTYSFQAAASNEHAMISRLPKNYPVVYKYRAVGEFSNTSEQREMLNYEAHLLFKSIMTIQQNQPVMDGTAPGEFYDAVMARLASFRGEHATETRWGAELFSSEEPYSMEALRGADISDAIHGQAYDLWEQSLRARTPEILQGQYEELQSTFENVSKAYIEDFGKGPAYLETLLNDYQFGFVRELDNTIENIRNDLQNLKNALNRDLDYCDQCFEALQSAGIFSRKRCFETYQNSAATLYNDRGELEYFNKWLDKLLDFRGWVNAYASRNLLFFNRAVESINKDLETRVEKVDLTQFRLTSIESIQANIKKIFGDQQTREQLQSNVLRGIADLSFRAQLNANERDAAVELIQSISHFVNDTYRGINQESLQQSLTSLGTVPAGMTVAQYAQNLLAVQMENGARPLFATSAAFANLPTNSTVRMCYLSIPHTATQIMEGLQKYVENSGSYQGAVFKPSLITDRILWMNTVAGLPLCAYGSLPRYEEVYETMRVNHRGLHLIQPSLRPLDQETARTDWRLLPSPNPYMLTGMKAPSAYLESRRKKYDAMMGAAEKNGVLVLDMGDAVSAYTAKMHFFPTGKEGILDPAVIDDQLAEAMRQPTAEAKQQALQAILDSRREKELLIDRHEDKMRAFATEQGVASIYGTQAHTRAEEEAIREAEQRCYRAVVYSVLGMRPAIADQVLVQMDAAKKVVDALRTLSGNVDEVRRKQDLAKEVARMLAYGLIRVLPMSVLYQDSAGEWEHNGEANMLFKAEKNLHQAGNYAYLPQLVRFVDWLSDQDSQRMPQATLFTQLQAFDRSLSISEDEQVFGQIAGIARFHADSFPRMITDLHHQQDHIDAAHYDLAMKLIEAMKGELSYRLTEWEH